MKIIVTHLSPDIDAITAVWLIKRFLPKWQEAKLKFVPAGSTLDNNPPDKDPNIIHVDTGFGRFDHHQTKKFTCAAQLVFNFLKEKKYLKKNQIEPLERLINQINNFDHFQEVYFPNPSEDYYEFMIGSIIDSGLKNILKDDEKIVLAIFPFLDALLNIFSKKISAEKEIKKGYIFQSFYGKTLVLQTKNEETIKLGQKMGFKLVARKDPETGHIRIKTLPDKKLSLKPLYEKIIQVDKKATWFLHKSENMLLNSSSKNPNFIPSKLTIYQLIEIIKSIK